jgi:anti-sigma regulatory factor (Ser/Thr protein kinase)
VARQDEVRLVVPAMPEFLRLARVTAAGLASRLGFTFDQVEDLRLAIDELCYGLTGNHGRPGGTVNITYVVGDDSLEVEGVGRFGRAQRAVELTELSQVILAALVDEHELTEGDDGPRFRLVKRRTHPQVGG